MRDRDGGHHSHSGGGADFPILGADAGDPDPVRLVAARRADSPFVLLGDHAGNLIPRRLAGLGLSEDALARHIAVDIGVAQLGEALAERTGAAFIAQRYSRLVIDCNRDPASPEAIPAVSDATAVPGNAALGAAARAARVGAVHEPYHAAVAALLDRRAGAQIPTIVVALHSFTPVLAGVARPWTLGVLHTRAPDVYAARVLAALRAGGGGEVVGDNQPYAFDGTDYTVPRHAIARGLGWVEIEVRQDQLATGEGVARKADLLARALAAAAA